MRAAAAAVRKGSTLELMPLDWHGVWAHGFAAQVLVQAGYLPVYLRQTPSDVTGEFSAILIRPLDHEGNDEEDGAMTTAPAGSSLLNAGFGSRSPLCSGARSGTSHRASRCRCSLPS